jgi:phage shock protein A
MDGLNALLSEYLKSVSLTLGKNVTRETIAEIRKESAQVIASQREIVKEYDLEEELLKTLKFF